MATPVTFRGLQRGVRDSGLADVKLYPAVTDRDGYTGGPSANEWAPRSGRSPRRIPVTDATFVPPDILARHNDLRAKFLQVMPEVSPPALPVPPSESPAQAPR